MGIRKWRRPRRKVRTEKPPPYDRPGRKRRSPRVADTVHKEESLNQWARGKAGTLLPYGTARIRHEEGLA